MGCFNAALFVGFVALTILRFLTRRTPFMCRNVDTSATEGHLILRTQRTGGAGDGLLMFVTKIEVLGGWNHCSVEIEP